MNLNNNMNDKEKIVDQYTVTGVPTSLLPAMCKELNINEDKLNEWLKGQTMAMVGNEGLVYPWDIKRFINNLPIID
jgi:hypothetical protein